MIALGIVTGPGNVAAAAPNGNAVCVAERIAVAHSLLRGRALSEAIVVPDARSAGAGDTIAPHASTDCGAG